MLNRYDSKKQFNIKLPPGSNFILKYECGRKFYELNFITTPDSDSDSDSEYDSESE
jgi:hypothetical protein